MLQKKIKRVRDYYLATIPLFHQEPLTVGMCPWVIAYCWVLMYNLLIFQGTYYTKSWITDQDDKMMGCGFCEFTLWYSLVLVQLKLLINEHFALRRLFKVDWKWDQVLGNIFYFMYWHATGRNCSKNVL